ncbi:MAG: glutamate--tRNA ligase, partial [Schwartzia sp.]|nr:glutamate--tRNA ligase [Schwartzia sp. (in: firmicutes)]
ALLGWSPKSNQEIFSMEELERAFSLEGLSKSPAVFDYAKLDWFNGEYFKRMSDEDFASAALPFAGELPEVVAAKWPYLAAILRTRVARFGEIPGKIAFFRALPDYGTELFANKRNKVTPELAAEILPATKDVLAGLSDWTPEAIDEALDGYIDACGRKLGTVMWPLRVALSGQTVTPGGVTELLYLLGKEEALARIDTAVGKLA